jgi:hypothetical protein
MKFRIVLIGAAGLIALLLAATAHAEMPTCESRLHASGVDARRIVIGQSFSMEGQLVVVAPGDTAGGICTRVDEANAPLRIAQRQLNDSREENARLVEKNDQLRVLAGDTSPLKRNYLAGWFIGTFSLALMLGTLLSPVTRWVLGLGIRQSNIR